ncbi:cation:proton antiporter [Candidatus Woesearchaeota archaeon]|nr:cation:proton antiporter [Candidatus Woesearchaeota archaeon]
MIDGASQTFLQLGLIFIIAAATAYVLRLLKQPQILAYVLVGILLTPVFKIITNTSIIDSISVIGIAFLLFIVGLEIDIKAVKNVALVSSLGGTIQIVVLFVVGYLAALILGYLGLEAAYIGLMIAFSSTMVVMKVLSDRRELNTLHGRLAIGILLTNDVLAILVLSVLSSINHFSFYLLGISLLKFISMFLIAYLASKYLFPPVFKFAAKNQELLLTSSLAVCFLFSIAFFKIGFSVAIGAFIAGVTLGNLAYSVEIAGKVKSLKDFFALLFFVSLGMGISPGTIKTLWLPILILLLLVIFFKPGLTMTICSLFRYTKKPAFLTANSLAQVGEFSLIIAAQGLALGHISADLFSIVVVIMLATITTSSYFMEYEDGLYRLLQRPLRIFDRFTTEGLEYLPTTEKPKVVLCGYNRIGYSIAQGLQDSKKKLLIVDYNPEVITQLIKEGYHSIYGDVTDEEVLEHLNLPKITMLISTVPAVNDNILLIRKVRSCNHKAQIIVTASEVDDALRLYREGADYVILPHFLGGEHVSNLIAKVKDKSDILDKEKAHHIEHLRRRKALGHEHPKQG